jgi:polyhydroxyalkanoate synthase
LHPPAAEKWFAESVEHPGSWWNDWAAWQDQYKGGTVPATKKLGAPKYRSLADAPGEYVKVRL